MESYSKKLNYILPVFLAVAIGTTVGVALLRWLVSIQFHLLDLKEEVWEIWMPLALPWIPILIWLRPRFKALTFKKDADRKVSFFHFMTWFVMIAMMMFSQHYLTTATGKLQVLNNIHEMDDFEKVRYYRINEFEVAPEHAGVRVDFRTSGKRNEHLNIDIFFVCPILRTANEELSNAMFNWYGIKFHEQISNQLDEDEKEAKYEAFFDECVDEYEHYDFHDLDHFQRQPTSADRDNFLLAIKNRIVEEPDERYAVLIPVKEAYEDRNGNKFAWIFGSFGIGTALLMLLLLWPGIDEKEMERHLAGKKPKEDELRDMLLYLIPRGDHLVTSIILDLNILVFVVMVLFGVHIISPNGHELLEWGANRRAETLSGDWWRLFTSMFLHGGIMHLLLNIYGLGLAAIFIEPVLGRRNYALLYILSGLCGSLASIWWYPNTISVGASGAIFGLYGAILSLLLTDAFPKGGKQGMLVMFGIYVAINLLMGLTGGIDNAAHIGGLLSGAVFGFVFYTLSKRTKFN